MTSLLKVFAVLSSLHFVVQHFCDVMTSSGVLMHVQGLQLSGTGKKGKRSASAGPTVGRRLPPLLVGNGNAGRQNQLAAAPARSTSPTANPAAVARSAISDSAGAASSGAASSGASTGEREGEAPETCIICLQPERGDEDGQLKPMCTSPSGAPHLVHKKCGKEWGARASTCPMCRGPLQEEMRDPRRPPSAIPIDSTTTTSPRPREDERTMMGMEDRDLHRFFLRIESQN
ncbi:unnamed protein product [Amoebophrya sp. A120]|nr:unnamed protein product [Amoebophrya sp. A120]|eukprot:GSA120T00024777001.1